jgi:dTDP-4-dehydrorhamnose 3,5-epimerase|tara:strand:- start:388 stop:918 length:531 start_codon:yes stop_codon:yes gene_type:complete
MNTIKSITESTKINDLKTITLDIFKDYRGEIWTVYSDIYTDLKFVADKVTISRLGVLRGFHGDPHTAKLITCLSGQFQLAVVDTRKNSKTYGNVETYLVSDNEPMVVIVPAGCVNAHLCLSDKCVFYYKWSEHYKEPEEQVTIAWNDPDINANWLIESPILSDRDKKGCPLKGIEL